VLVKHVYQIMPLVYVFGLRMLFWSLVRGRVAVSKFVSATWTWDLASIEDPATATAYGPANSEPAEGIDAGVCTGREQLR
jgi:hypothetical protein